MWPKVLAQLIELLPHASRLIPLAEKYFGGQSGPVGATLDADSRRALDELRAELGKGATAQESVYRQMNEQSAQLAAVSAEVQASRTLFASLDARLVALEATQRKQTSYLLAILVLVVLSALATPFLIWAHSR